MTVVFVTTNVFVARFGDRSRCRCAFVETTESLTFDSRVDEFTRLVHRFTPTPSGKVFDTRVKSAGVPKFRLHDVRHTHATLLLAAGANAKVVSERLGHSSVAFTLDTYAHAMPGQQADATAAVARLVDGAK